MLMTLGRDLQEERPQLTDHEHDRRPTRTRVRHPCRSQSAHSRRLVRFVQPSRPPVTARVQVRGHLHILLRRSFLALSPRVRVATRDGSRHPGSFSAPRGNFQARLVREEELIRQFGEILTQFASHPARWEARDSAAEARRTRRTFSIVHVATAAATALFAGS